MSVREFSLDSYGGDSHYHDGMSFAPTSFSNLATLDKVDAYDNSTEVNSYLNRPPFDKEPQPVGRVQSEECPCKRRAREMRERQVFGGPFGEVAAKKREKENHIDMRYENSAEMPRQIMGQKIMMLLIILITICILVQSYNMSKLYQTGMTRPTAT
jgi:hypothetical protein